MKRRPTSRVLPSDVFTEFRRLDRENPYIFRLHQLMSFYAEDARGVLLEDKERLADLLEMPGLYTYDEEMATIESFLSLLERDRKILRYEGSDGRRYIWLRTFHRHQKIPTNLLVRDLQRWYQGDYIPEPSISVREKVWASEMAKLVSMLRDPKRSIYKDVKLYGALPDEFSYIEKLTTREPLSLVNQRKSAPESPPKAVSPPSVSPKSNLSVISSQSQTSYVRTVRDDMKRSEASHLRRKIEGERVRETEETPPAQNFSKTSCFSGSIPLLEHISAFTELKKTSEYSAEWSGSCPFPWHEDEHPSFYVNNAKQKWFCHGCGIGGDIVAFQATLTGKNHKEPEDFKVVLADLGDRYGFNLKAQQERYAMANPPLPKDPLADYPKEEALFAREKAKIYLKGVDTISKMLGFSESYSVDRSCVDRWARLILDRPNELERSIEVCQKIFQTELSELGNSFKNHRSEVVPLPQALASVSRRGREKLYKHFIIKADRNRDIQLLNEVEKSTDYDDYPDVDMPENGEHTRGFISSDD